MIENPNNPLENALNALDLQGTLVLLHLLSQKALYMQQEEAKGKSKLIAPKSTLIT